MRSSKSRSRNKGNRNRSNMGNVVNRVFDSSGPEGKVRGTPQQIIDKYNQLARDAQLSGDRVATENFQQHSEHYLRLLTVAQKEQDARREEHERQNRERQAERDRERAQRQEREAAGGIVDPGSAEQPAMVEVRAQEEDSGLVETPENKEAQSEVEKPAKPKRARKPRKVDPAPVEESAVSEASASDSSDGPKPPEAAE
ncbi:MAG: DUF4167 domain-containing protein [Pseudomonadota bacterium]